MTEPIAARRRIAYLEPLERAWARMVEQLFRPFDISQWFVLGFACWLSQLAGGGGGGGGHFNFNIPAGVFEDEADAATFGRPAGRLPDWLDPENFLEPALIGCVVLFGLLLLVVVVVLLWVGSRGQFMFLDGVVRRRARIVEPWSEFRREGNSLFLWQLGYLLVVVVGVVAVMAPGIGLMIVAGRSGESVVPGFLVLVALLVPSMVVVAYISFFLTGFVVPIMYRERLRTAEAWRVFLPLFRAEWPRFLLVGLFVAALWLVVALGIVVVGFATCCILFVVLIIPYIGTVAMLPLYVTYRAYTLEFLAQFAPRFDLFGAPPEPVAPPPLPA